MGVASASGAAKSTASPDAAADAGVSHGAEHAHLASKWTPCRICGHTKFVNEAQYCSENVVTISFQDLVAFRKAKWRVGETGLGSVVAMLRTVVRL
jgi:hypothetical protein